VTDEERHQLARARSEALAVNLTATAVGVFEPTTQLLDATAPLACSLAFDLAAA
jgi:hypothetical protein